MEVQELELIIHNWSALVPGDTNVGDAFVFSDRSYPVPLVLRGACREMDASLGNIEAIKHFTVVGEYFVEGIMGRREYREENGTSQTRLAVKQNHLAKTILLSSCQATKLTWRM